MDGNPGPTGPRGGPRGAPAEAHASPEVLDLGDGEHRRGPAWSRRTWTVLGVVAALVLALAWWGEDRTRRGVEEELAGCRQEASTRVRATERSLSAMADYLRPGLLAVPEAARGSLYVAMSEAAADDVPQLRTALEVCRAVDASWLQGDLQRERDDYVDFLEGTLERVQGVVADGRRYYRDTPELDAQRDRLIDAG